MKLPSILIVTALALGSFSGCSVGGSDNSAYNTADTSNIVELTSATEPAFIAKDVAVIKFYATWCGPCKAMTPNYVAASNELAGQAAFAEVDVDKSGDLANKYGINSIPALIIFKQGKQVEKIGGYQGTDQILAAISKHL